MNIQVMIIRQSMNVLKALGGSAEEAISNTRMTIASEIEAETQNIARRKIYNLPESPNYKRTWYYWQSIAALFNKSGFAKVGIKVPSKVLPESLPDIPKNYVRVGIYAKYAKFVEWTCRYKTKNKEWTRAGKEIFTQAKNKVLKMPNIIKILKAEINDSIKRNLK